MPARLHRDSNVRESKRKGRRRSRPFSTVGDQDKATTLDIGRPPDDIVLAGADLGGARRRLAASFDDLAAEIAGRFARMLALAGSQTTDTHSKRRELLRRVIALKPAADRALGGHRSPQSAPRADC